MKKLISLILALSLILSLAACGKSASAREESPSAETSAPVETTPAPEAEASEDAVPYQGNPWNCSSIIGNLSAEKPDEADDFYQSANYDILAEARGSAFINGANSFEELMLDYILNSSDSSKTLDSIRLFYNQARDTEAFKTQELSPIEPYIGRIEAASSIEELNAVITADDYPFDAFIYTLVQPFGMEGQNLVYIGSNLVMVDPMGGSYDYQTDVSDSDNWGMYITEKYYNLISYLLYSGMEIEEAMEYFTNALLFEQQYGQYVINNEDYGKIEYGTADSLYALLSLSEIEAMAGDFPIGALLNKEGRGNEALYFMEKPEWLEAFGDIYTEENLEMLKTMCILSVAGEAFPYLTPEIYAGVRASDGYDTSEYFEDYILDYTSYYALSQGKTLGNALASIYCEEIISEENKSALIKMTDEIIDAYVDIISSCSWISDNSRDEILKKLSHMSKNILVPETGYCSYDELELIPTEEGGTLLQNYFILKDYNIRKQNLRLGLPADSSATFSYFGGSFTNAFYEPTANSMHLLPGLLNDDTCNFESEETLLGTMGFIVAHEVSHAMDNGGSQFDCNGLPNAVFSEEDKAIYLDKIQKIVDYYSSIELCEGMYINGSLVSIESAADLCAMATLLRIASEKEGFDYDLFYRSFASIWWTSMDYDTLLLYYASDEHALNYLRVNINCAMFPEFKETYGVSEGDRMYVAPGDILSLWW